MDQIVSVLKNFSSSLDNFIAYMVLLNLEAAYLAKAPFFPALLDFFLF